MDWSKVAAACLVMAVPSLACADAPARATAEFKGCGEAKVTGTATLTEQVSAEGVKEVKVEMKVQGLADGKHAVHIHEVGACTPCGDAKGHFDPGPAGKSSPDGNHPYHSGDLVNLEVKGATGKMKTTTSRVGPRRRRLDSNARISVG